MMKKRIFALLIALCLIVGVLPVTALALEDTEPNDTLATAQEFTMGDTINGRISENEDADWYKFTLDASGRISFKATSYMEYYSVWLYDDEGNELWEDYGNAANSDTGMRADTYDIDLIEGTYYLKVSGKHGGSYNIGYSSGNYTLTTSYTNANVDETEPNDTMQEAQQIPLDGVFNGQCALNNREDYYRIELPADGELSLTVTSYMDYYSVWLFDSDGNEIWSDYGNERDSEAISRKDTYTLHLVQGTYYLKVSGQHGSGYNIGYSTGNYTFKLNTENPFSDVPADSFYYDPVLWAVEQGITSGTTGTTFSPNDACMRAHVVTFLWRAAGSPAPESAVNPFTDVKTSDFFYKPVLWAVENGITTGTSATTFSPTGVCNRAQVVTFLHRAFESPAAATSLPFTDVPAGAWYEAPIAWAVENGITNGLTATEFGPTSPCNRAQVVTFLYRAYND